MSGIILNQNCYYFWPGRQEGTISLILQLRTLRFREVQWLFPSHTALGTQILWPFYKALHKSCCCAQVVLGVQALPRPRSRVSAPLSSPRLRSDTLQPAVGTDSRLLLAGLRGTILKWRRVDSPLGTLTNGKQGWEGGGHTRSLSMDYFTMVFPCWEVPCSKPRGLMQWHHEPRKLSSREHSAFTFISAK